MEYTGKSKHYMFVDHMQYNIMELVNECFDKETDPEVSWAIFREQLRKIKKGHVESYLEYLESDVEEELPESEYAKYKRENPQYFKK